MKRRIHLYLSPLEASRLREILDQGAHTRGVNWRPAALATALIFLAMAVAWWL